MKTKILIQKLIQKGFHICCAESCTGGMLSATLVSESGASQVVSLGLVTYSNEMKEKMLGVKHSSLSQFGAVSECVAGEMASGAARVSNAQIGVGVTGIAGPTGAVPGKPVGTVCFGFYIDGKLVTKTKHFDGDRQSVRQSAVDFAIDYLTKEL